MAEPVSNKGKFIQRFPEEPQLVGLKTKAPRASLQFAPD